MNYQLKEVEYLFQTNNNLSKLFISLAMNVALIYKEKIYSLLLLNLERWKIQVLLYLFQTKMN